MYIYNIMGGSSAESCTHPLIKITSRKMIKPSSPNKSQALFWTNSSLLPYTQPSYISTPVIILSLPMFRRPYKHRYPKLWFTSIPSLADSMARLSSTATIKGLIFLTPKSTASSPTYLNFLSTAYSTTLSPSLILKLPI